MLMFSRLWNRIGDRWLVSRSASNMFGAAAILIVVVTALLAFNMAQDTGLLSEVFWAVAGVLSGLGAFFIWSGMWRFWSRLDQSSRFARRVWFVTLLIGLWYGAVLYFVLVYMRSPRTSFAENRGDAP
jgi:hypothetical protein